jgi:hypothetical protein
MRRMLLLWLVICSQAALGGCNKHKLIPNTKIEDTPVNRDILKVVETYRRAMEARDPARIFMLVHDSYRDSNGTPEPNDDFDYHSLKSVLSKRLKQTSRVRYRIEFQRMATKGRQAHLDVWIDATFVYEHPESPPRYSRFTDYHRYTLLKTDKGWRFISGL